MAVLAIIYTSKVNPKRNLRLFLKILNLYQIGTIRYNMKLYLFVYVVDLEIYFKLICFLSYKSNVNPLIVIILLNYFNSVSSLIYIPGWIYNWKS